jgi:plastocyanin
VKNSGLIGLVAILLAAGACAFSFVALRGEEAPREVVLIAKDMAFVADRPSAVGALNPTIILSAGERVRLVVRNLDAGMRHDLIVDHLQLRTLALDFGESDGLVFTAPTVAGEWDYYCSFHSRLMRGRIVVR